MKKSVRRLFWQTFSRIRNLGSPYYTAVLQALQCNAGVIVMQNNSLPRLSVVILQKRLLMNCVNCYRISIHKQDVMKTWSYTS